MLSPEGRVRVLVEGVRPEIDCGAFPAKRTVGEFVVVEADIFTDGPALVGGEILYRYEREEVWRRSSMKPVGIDRWSGDFLASKVGKYYYTIEGWIDRFGTWRNAMIKRIDSGQDLRAEFLIGAFIVEEAASQAASDDAARLHDLVPHLARRAEPGGRKASGSGRRNRSALFSDIPTVNSPPAIRKNYAWLSTGSGPAFPRGMKCFRAPARPRLAVRERCAIVRRGFRMSLRWVLTSCTCRRFIR